METRPVAAFGNYDGQVRAPLGPPYRAPRPPIAGSPDIHTPMQDPARAKQ